MNVQHFKNIRHLRSFFLQPDYFIKKVGRKIRKLCKDFIIDGPTRRLIDHNRQMWKGYGDPASDGIVLVSWDEIPNYIVLMLHLANILAKQKQARIVTFAYQSWGQARAMHAVYRSFNATEHVVMGKLGVPQKARANQIFDEAVKTLRSKEDVFRLTVHGIHLGIDVYESYLREYSKPTVVIDDGLLAVLCQAIDYLVFWEDYVEHHKVVGLIVSHDCYVNYNIACKVAYKNKIPVYAPLGASFGLFKKPHDSFAFFPSFKGWFASLSEEEKIAGKALAKRQLEKRFGGEAGGDLFYTSVSAFRSRSDAAPALRPSEKLKVLICPHCFYDNPHGYGGFLFIDFYEWLKYLVQIAEKTDYDWYLKTHPSPLPGTLENIREILGSSKITVIPSKTSHHQLVKEGINWVVTGCGTVGHEYPVSGVQVINAGYNPHVAYDFTWTPKNLKEYEWMLLNLKDLKKDIQVEDIYEFYFMNYYYRHVDDLVYSSYRDIYSRLSSEQSLSSALYAYYLEGFTMHRHQESVRRMEDFLASGKDYLFTKGPVNRVVAGPLAAYVGAEK